MQLNAKKKSNIKIGRRSIQTFFFPKEAIQMASRYAKMVLNITNHQGTANPNHNKLSPHPQQQLFLIFLITAVLTDMR